jgi:hypothetical protein
MDEQFRLINMRDNKEEQVGNQVAVWLDASFN